MDFIDQLRKLAARVEKLKDTVQTEEATKTSMIMPFIQILGYNVFDPDEVTPEFTADVGTKKGEKVDYAILNNGNPDILFECKKIGSDLSSAEASQLFRYFSTTSARIGVLTNGSHYRFYSDLDNINKMDDKPFLEFNMLDFKDADAKELRRFTKPDFNIANILATANELKYSKFVREKLLDLLANPSEEFVRMVSVDALSNRRFTQQVREQFTEITKRVFDQIISEKINERLKGAMAPELPLVQEADVSAQGSDGDSTGGIETTEEELLASHIIKSLLREVVDPQRITVRDQQTYCVICLDDNSRKTICRLRFNNTKNLRISLFINGKDEQFPLNNVYDISQYSDILKSTVNSYLGSA